MRVVDWINYGGFLAYLLVGLSVISVAIIINRAIYFILHSRPIEEAILAKIRISKNNGSFESFLALNFEHSPFFKLAIKVIALENKDMHYIKPLSNNILKDFSKYLNILATIATISVYIGLLGTIFGIMGAFNNIAFQGRGGVEVVIGGVSKALVTTALGLIVSIPATVAYNYFVTSVDSMKNRIKLFTEKLFEIIQ